MLCPSAAAREQSARKAHYNMTLRTMALHEVLQDFCHVPVKLQTVVVKELRSGQNASRDKESRNLPTPSVKFCMLCCLVKCQSNPKVGALRGFCEGFWLLRLPARMS